MLHAQVDLGRAVPVQAVIDAHFWGEADAVEVRADLADTQIYLCAPEVLMLFSDNFDYQVGSCLCCPPCLAPHTHGFLSEQSRPFHLVHGVRPDISSPLSSFITSYLTMCSITCTVVGTHLRRLRYRVRVGQGKSRDRAHGGKGSLHV